MSHLHSHVSAHLMTVVDDFLFFVAVILAAPSVSVSNSIVKFADLLILIFMMKKSV
jgi:hypothetical protein